jgi:SAM-dependent methyltransferase
MELEPYEQFYYSHQTKGRGLQSAQELTRAFELMARSSDEIFGPLLPKNGVAVDIACGYGSMLFYFEKRGLTASGFDLDQNQIDLARSIGLNARHGDLSTEVKQINGPVNVISAMDVIEHLHKNDAIELLRQIYERLPSGGLLLLRCPCADGFTGAYDVFNDLTHKWGATSVVVRQLLVAIGFARVELMDISLPRYPSTLRSKARARALKITRRFAGLFLQLLGIKAPEIWSTSVVAVAWK